MVAAAPGLVALLFRPLAIPANAIVGGAPGPALVLVLPAAWLTPRLARRIGRSLDPRPEPAEPIPPANHAGDRENEG